MKFLLSYNISYITYSQYIYFMLQSVQCRLKWAQYTQCIHQLLQPNHLSSIVANVTTKIKVQEVVLDLTWITRFANIGDIPMMSIIITFPPFFNKLSQLVPAGNTFRRLNMNAQITTKVSTLWFLIFEQYYPN